ncbi:uncharacterized protein LOC107046227 [Diachasma alloeum]|uniref:uncharacterized protein LOC107044009 n=1 Tax=Diachasma alloeum TaxID=454923 RepID=UPI0007382DB6|nr:uncharacterized protein LOC107044009 [Diachasma alloeum]XP_015124278.1 uncharacterized protein LOC107046227 [Diachasma alloeum]
MEKSQMKKLICLVRLHREVWWNGFSEYIEEVWPIWNSIGAQLNPPISGYQAWSTFLKLGEFFYTLLKLKRQSEETFTPVWEYFEDLQFLLTPEEIPYETPSASEEEVQSD